MILDLFKTLTDLLGLHSLITWQQRASVIGHETSPRQPNTLLSTLRPSLLLPHLLPEQPVTQSILPGFSLQPQSECFLDEPAGAGHGRH